MIDISVVSGTYNRLPSLKRMVESGRQSAQAYGLRVEFVLVDGGSTDGTLDWCKSQADIHLIEHGRLLGAVKAFNDGAYAAKGSYVIMSNDDIEFLGQSILTAFIYMQSNPDCGMGCFYQDRERQHLSDNDPNKWYVSEMPVVVDERQTSRPYGQICIVPKWLGDRVGWWGDYLHTYGGDNELTSLIYELGFKVSPIPTTRISDHELQDGLRTINNFGHGADPKKTLGHHPDSYAWGRKWQFPGRRDRVNGQVVTGPTIRPTPLLENHTEIKERIIYLPIYEQGRTVQKEQKRGLREALSKVGLVFEFDYVSADRVTLIPDLIDLMKYAQPTLILTQLHNGSVINAGDVIDMRRFYPHGRWVNWNGDFWPDNLLSEDGLNLARTFDLQLGVNRDAIEKQKEAGVNAAYWQIGYEIDGVGCQNDSIDSICDVVFLASGYSPARQTFVKKLRGLPVEFHLYGPGWKEGSRGDTIYDFKKGCQIYQGAKISIGDSQWPETGFVSNRVFQALAAGGSALAHQWFKDMDKLGLIDGETCIIWKSFEDLESKIYYYLKHEEERKRIAEAGQRMCLEKHSFDVRVKELFAMFKPQEETNWRW